MSFLHFVIILCLTITFVIATGILYINGNNTIWICIFSFMSILGALYIIYISLIALFGDNV